MPNKINIGLVEDQLLFREGMKAILGNWQELEVVFESPDGYSVIEKLDSCTKLPHVMLVDLTLPPFGKMEYSGLQVTRVLVDKYPQMKILILSVHEDDNFINQLIENGAHGYLSKGCNPKEIYDAIVSVQSKGSYINERTLKAIQNNLTKKPSNRQINLKLSKREEEVLQLVCQQLTAEEIGEKLFISTKTVNGHRTHLLEKTGSRNVTGLVLYAIKNNILEWRY